jgi:hypothetical protein
VQSKRHLKPNINKIWEIMEKVILNRMIAQLEKIKSIAITSGKILNAIKLAEVIKEVVRTSV